MCHLPALETKHWQPRGSSCVLLSKHLALPQGAPLLWLRCFMFSYIPMTFKPRVLFLTQMWYRGVWFKLSVSGLIHTFIQLRVLFGVVFVRFIQVGT